jgi:NAD(P)-dependent dehydrogenase (short-subunit alcohol dehydrogenase family)
MTAAKTAMITGASTGIGYATAAFLITKGWHVFAGVRKQADADRLSDALGESVTPVLCDVTKGDEVKAAGETVRAALGDAALSALVNNAGVAVAGPLLHLPVEEMQQQMEINVTGQLRAVQAFAPLMGAGEPRNGPPGRIVNISSVAGFSAMPLVTPYACSKHAMEAFTQGLRRELLLYGIDVVAINPGPIATPIWSKAEEIDATLYANTDYDGPIQRILGYMLERGKTGLPPERVAEAVHDALTASKPKLNTVITPDGFQNWLLNTLPGRMADRLIAKRLGLMPASGPR